MAAFASDRRSGWVRVLVLILCALFIFATVATPPAYAVGETVALFGLAAVLSAATAALGFKLANNAEGQATLQKMVQDFAGASIAAGLVLTGSKVNGLINGMQYIKMAVHNGKTYLDERIFAWCQQWLAKNGVYDELRQDLAIQKTEINDLVSKWLTLKLTDEWIEKVLNLASHGRFPQVQALAQKYFNMLTNHHYVSVEYGKKIKVKTETGTKFDVKELSKGTMQQLYLALIFALTMSFSDEYPMPIIIDDGFVDFDHVRTNAAIELMKEISNTTQVIYFTADDRIEKQVKSEDLLKLS